MELTEFVEQAAYILRRAYRFSKKANRKGLMALEFYIDGAKRAQRDIFEYGV